MKRSKHNLSHYKLFTCDMGELVPIGLTEVLPGDTVQHATSALIRCSPLLAPVMHPVNVRIHHWYVPHRLVWPEFEDLITAGPNGTSIPVFPTMSAPGSVVGVGTLSDYLGVPQSLGTAATLSALPFRAYNLIWNEWYRDQDLQTELPISTASGSDSTTQFLMQNVAWEKDYFTTARPWEQKGPAVTIPLGTSAPVVSTGVQPTLRKPGAGESGGMVMGNAGGAAGTRLGIAGVTATSADVAVDWGASGASSTGLRTDLTSASSVTVGAFRQALALQRFEEARARYGSRYTEYLRYLGVRSSDARLQRPEYLGGGKQTIQFSEVLATAETGSTVKVGDLKGHGIAAMRSNRYRRFFEEHGYVLSLMSSQPRTMYTQGLARHWSKRNKESFWQREFEHIGQQNVLAKEVYAASTAGDAVFGYQDRYDEYRRTESTIAGEFRTVLDYWHMGRIFASEPALNATFVKSNPTKRNFASSATDSLYIMARHNMIARRLVTKVGTSFTS